MEEERNAKEKGILLLWIVVYLLPTPKASGSRVQQTKSEHAALQWCFALNIRQAEVVAGIMEGVFSIAFSPTGFL
ncbi:unnamed protein product [Sphagnum tenellum]